MTQEEIDALISGADDTGLEEDASETTTEQQAIDSAQFADMQTTQAPSGSVDPKMDLLYDLSLPVLIELGRTNMLIRDVLKLGRGSVVEFDKLVSEPVDVLINGKKIAEGEVVVIDKHFGIRITTLVDPSQASRARR